MGTLSRRQFIKNALVTGATITAFPTVFVRKAPAAWARKTVVHPEVDNLRVVGITDPAMTKTAETIPLAWADQDKLVVTEAVWANIDRLACALAQTRNSAEAWRQIFIKPPSKSWAETVVAIKTNHIGQQHTHSAIMAKMCHVMSDTLGVKPSNIHIYDACHGATINNDTPFALVDDAFEEYQSICEGYSIEPHVKMSFRKYVRQLAQLKIVASKTVRIEDATRGRHLEITLLDIPARKLAELLEDIFERKFNK